MLYLTFAVLTAFLAITSAHNIQMKAHSRECFHEQLHKDDKMTVTFQVGDREFGGSGNLELDFWIQKPDNSYQVHERAVSAGDHSFVAPMDGRYTYCFSNEHWSANTKEVSFNVHGIVYVPESEAPQDPLEKEVRQLSELVAQVKDEQGYIIIRERTHRNTAESTNARVKWWSIFQLLVLLGEGIFQVWWLKRFFEVSIAGRAPACRYSPMSAGQACSVTEDAILAIVDQHENPFKAYLLSSHSPPILA
ncbi:p24 complex component [Coniosporium apollinis]|uniref:P24 complex component n=2 Tax=Coniosporium TaxID=2810619 RepID=A0ABQ9P498_9PEZI|nr:p24 complex component [Cladosporium sp. JES 115]KAJ9669437.1 p24 complex component [Coniosporium apollinis]